MGNIEEARPQLRRGGGLGERGAGRDHRIEQRQSDGDTRAPEQGPARKMLSGQIHDLHSSCRLHAECITRYNPRHERREPVIVLGRCAHNRPDLRHVLRLDLPAQRVHHELRCQRLDELAGAAQQGAAQVCRTFDFLAVWHCHLRIDGRIRLPIDIAPLPGDGEVLQRQSVGFDHTVAHVAGRIGAMLLEHRTHGLGLRARRRAQIRHHIRRRRRRRRAAELVENPGAAHHRRSPVAIGRVQQHGALAEKAIAILVLEMDAAELRAVHRCDAVVFRQPFIEERIVGR